MEPTPDPRKKPHDDGGWWVWFTSLFSSGDSARVHGDAGGETVSDHGAHDGGDAGHDAGDGSDGGGDGGGGDGGGGGD